MARRKYIYPGMELWQESAWDKKVNGLTGLIEKIGVLPEDRKGVDQDPDFLMDWETAKTLTGYQPRTNSLDSPEVIAYWEKKGMSYLSRMGNKIRHLYLMPEGSSGFPVLVIYHKENYADPFWALKTLRLFGDCCEKAAEKRFGIAFVVTDNEPDTRRTYYTLPTHISPYHPDPDRLYLDISLIREHGLRLKDIDFIYTDNDKKEVENPDEYTEDFCGIPVINIAGRTYEMFSLTYKSTTPYGMNNGMVDFDAVYNSEEGRRLMDGIRLEYFSESPDDGYAAGLFREMGLRLERSEYKGSPWWAFVPESSYDGSGKKLPLLAVPHFPLTGELGADILIAASFYFQFLKTAAMGECVLQFYPGNISGGGVEESAFEIICEGIRKFGSDKSRIYIAGHSRQGFVSQYIARTHPGFFAGLGILNDSPGIPDPRYSTEDIMVSDEELEKASRDDMPTVIVSGCCEDSSFFPVNEDAGGIHHASMVLEGYGASTAGRIEAWNRRLRSCGCREISAEEAMAAAGSSVKAVRKLGIPSDKAGTIYMDGHEHYVADIKNKKGKYHLRVIAEENTPHLCTPSGLELCWSYLRSFSRNTETGEIKEL